MIFFQQGNAQNSVGNRQIDGIKDRLRATNRVLDLLHIAGAR
jgi:hypothetical protein